MSRSRVTIQKRRNVAIGVVLNAAIVACIALLLIASASPEHARSSPAPRSSAAQPNGAGWFPAAASWYGPGFYGHHLACAGRFPGAPTTLHVSTIGVAHRTLPCGTRLTFRRHGVTVHLRVIDRGPYVDGVDWDLTGATAQRLCQCRRPDLRRAQWRSGWAVS